MNNNPESEPLVTISPVSRARLCEELEQLGLDPPHGNVCEEAVTVIRKLVADLETARSTATRYFEHAEHLKSELERMMGSFVIVLRSDLKRLINSEVPNEKG